LGHYGLKRGQSGAVEFPEHPDFPSPPHIFNRALTLMSRPPKAHDLSAEVEAARWFVEDVQPHEAAVRGYLRNTFPSVDVDDVVQESYLKLLKARTTGTIVATKAYFFSIARNTAIKFFHRRKFYSDTPVNELPDWRVLDDVPDAAGIANAAQRFELVSEALDHLPSRCRDVFRLAVLRGASNAEISHALGMAENTVRVQLRRGMIKCAEYVREREERR
jgi:RNA polymerase sigma-70 factor (ECF subfamily)